MTVFLRFVSAAAMGWLMGAATAHASGFEVAISPSRFEIAGKSAQRMGQSMDIHNLGASATEVSVRTLDWSYSEDGQLSFYDELRPDSCRPWVKLERKLVKIPARSKALFRFQVDIPADAPRGECRFMLTVEGVEPAYKALIQGGGASLSLPVNGRIAVAVYLAVNGAQPTLEMSQLTVREVQGKRTPFVTVSNRGDAHGRLEGSLDATDATGKAFELDPDSTPVLPGQTRTLALTPRAEGSQTPPQITFPIKAKGTIDWELGSFKIDAAFQ